MTDDLWDCHTHVFGAADDYPIGASSHYAPPVRTIEQLESVGAQVGVGHVVLVQPSVYGNDHRCLLEALRARGDRHRAVVVIPPSVSEAELTELHAAGARGVRFNLASPAGNRLDGFHDIVAKIAPLGWHVQFFIEPHVLDEIAELRGTTTIPFVLDHFAGLSPMTGDKELHKVLRLLDRGDFWIKLSGFYRLTRISGSSYSDMDALTVALGNHASERAVWGSDWPHTWFFDGKHGAGPAYGDTLAPILRGFAEATQRRILHDNPRVLYG